MLDQVFLLLLACEFYKITEGEILIGRPVTLIVYNRMKLVDLIKLNLEKAAVHSLISNRGRVYIKCLENYVRDYIFSKTLQLEFYEKYCRKRSCKTATTEKENKKQWQ